MTRGTSVFLLERMKSGYSLPTLSSIALRLVELASDETCSARDLASLIEKDLLEIMEKANQAPSHISERLTERGTHQAGSPLPTFDSMPGNGETVTRTLEAVAHEIRNPLLVVGGFAKRLADTLEPSSAGGKYARFILDEAERLERAQSKMTARKASE